MHAQCWPEVYAVGQHWQNIRLLFQLHCIGLYCIALYCIALHCIALHCIALHCIALHCIALHCIALHCIASHGMALHCTTLHCIALDCIALLCIALHYTALHYIVLHCITLHCIALHCIALCIALWNRFSTWRWLRAISTLRSENVHNVLITLRQNWNVTDSNQPIVDLINLGQVLVYMTAERNVQLLRIGRNLWLKLSVSSSVSASLGV